MRGGNWRGGQYPTIDVVDLQFLRQRYKDQDERQTTNDERRTTNDKRQTTNDKRRMRVLVAKRTSKEQNRKSGKGEEIRNANVIGKQRIPNSEQRTANSEQRRANSEQRTANSEQRRANISDVVSHCRRILSSYIVVSYCRLILSLHKNPFPTSLFLSMDLTHCSTHSSSGGLSLSPSVVFTLTVTSKFASLSA